MPLLLKVYQNDAKIRFYFPSIQEQTGWIRSNSLHLLTDYDTLLKITFFNYDLLNKEFVEYAKKRGCMNGAGSPSPIDPDYECEPLNLIYEMPLKINNDPHTIRRYARCHWLSKESFMSPKEKIYTVSVEGKKPKAISAKDKETLWLSILSTRARLQDCWEVYLINFCEAIVTEFSCSPKALPVPRLVTSRSHIKNYQEILPM